MFFTGCSTANKSPAPPTEEIILNGEEFEYFLCPSALWFRFVDGGWRCFPSLSADFPFCFKSARGISSILKYHGWIMGYRPPEPAKDGCCRAATQSRLQKYLWGSSVHSRDPAKARAWMPDHHPKMHPGEWGELPHMALRKARRSQTSSCRDS